MTKTTKKQSTKQTTPPKKTRGTGPQMVTRSKTLPNGQPRPKKRG